MKKLVLTIQIIALVTMFPVLLVVELNHRAERLPANNPPSENIEMLGESKIQPSLKSGDEGLSTAEIKMNVFYIIQ